MNYQFPEGRSAIKFKSFQSSNVNSVVYEIYDLGFRSPKNDAITRLLDVVVEEPFFDILRTKEQLAYSLSTSFKQEDHSNTFRLSLRYQEDKFSSKFITNRMRKFVTNDMKEILENLSDEKFKNIRDGKVREILQPFESNDDEARYNGTRIKDKSYIFDLYKKQAKVISTITKQDLLDFYTINFVNHKHRNLSIQVIGNSNEEENESMIMKFVTEKDDEEQ